MENNNWTHIPVMGMKIAETLLLKKDGAYIDGTLGLGGHTKYFLSLLGPAARVLGFDKDINALRMAVKNVNDARLAAFNKSYEFIPQVLGELGLPGVDGVLLDLGVSSYQLDDGRRGFSFQSEGPLDMRFDTGAKLTARDIVNDYSVRELEKIFTDYGEEPSAAKIALAVFNARRVKPLETTADLAAVINRATPRRGKTHPATRVFQALRIAVNDELGTIERSLKFLPDILNAGGRAAVLTFHSLEDRIIKNIFKQLAADGKIKLVNKHVIEPCFEEVQNNRRSRSAKLRVIEKI
ncbi:MAG: 16S rRNA (cytosine(1402)-N(4))-methyltransferase RsmH [Elusimicrobium sp.]|jgi:16S rRNA (cytosine1402-N4)-methyltransferase|nr:16S rRNA (cytosine(1402)-N(4))-methyltransferase RsmH [Elusimicrobium sp.]